MDKKRGDIKSVNDFKKKYFPKEVSKKYEEKTPQNLGVLWARDTFRKFKENLKTCCLI